MAIASVISPTSKRPGIFIDVALGVGPRTSGSAPKTVVLTGNKTTSGSALVEQEYDVYSADEGASLFGSGSELHIMIIGALLANTSVRLKCMAIAESAGTAATGTDVFSGTATSAGTCITTCMGEELSVEVNSGDTAAVLAARVTARVNQVVAWPITAANSTVTNTYTAKNKGPRGNHIAVRSRLVDAAGLTLTTLATGYLTLGATSDTPQNVLDALAAVQRTFIVAPYTDATNLAMYRTHIDAQDAPEVGHRKQVVYGSLDTLGNATTVATGLNFPRMQMVWLRGSDVPPCVNAAAMASYRAGREAIRASYNYDGDVLVGLKPQYISSLLATNGNIDSALDNGITPLLTGTDGLVRICRSITNKSQDSGGRPDYRVLDTSKVTVSDLVAENVDLAFSDFRGFNADNDPPNDQPPAPNTVTPSILRTACIQTLLQMEDDGDIAKGSTLALSANTQFELSSVSAGRFNGFVSFDVVEGFHQASVQARQVG